MILFLFPLKCLNNPNMSHSKNKLLPLTIEPRTKSIYPEPFASKVKGREKRALGDFFGIKKFGVNLTVLKPGAQSSLMHRHSKSEEFIYVLKGEITLVNESEQEVLFPGECAGFIPEGKAHMLKNNTQEEVHYLEIGDREPGDQAEYPQDDIKGSQNELGKWIFHHKDGRPY